MNWPAKVATGAPVSARRHDRNLGPGSSPHRALKLVSAPCEAPERRGRPETPPPRPFRTEANLASFEAKFAELRRERKFGESYRLFRSLHPTLQGAARIRREMAATHFEAGDAARAERWARLASLAAPKDSGAFGVMLIALCAQGRLAQGVAAIEEADPKALECDWALETFFRALGARIEAGGPPAKIARKLAELAAILLEAKGGIGLLSRARMYRFLGRFDRAGAMLRKLQAEQGSSAAIAREAVELALASQCWHEHIDLLRTFAAESEPAGDESGDRRTQAADMLRWHDAVSRFYDERAPCVRDFAIPDSTFEMMFAARRGFRSDHVIDVALVGATLAAGGAENALCNAQLGLQRHSNLSSELWIYSLDARLGHDFFLRDHAASSDIARSTRPIDRKTEPPAPFSWLPGDTGEHACAVHRALVERPPKIVHAWQDSTNLEVAFAAIRAGVPKIVIHPHNMRPVGVHRTPIAKSFRRAYRALLARPEVRLVCVSQASLADYLDWLELPRCDRHHVVHNGFEWRRLPSPERLRMRRSELLKQFGIDPACFVVGGMFRIVELKRPELWFEIASIVVRSNPDARFLLFGDGPGLPALRERVARSGLSDRILLAGQVANAAEKCAAFDLLLHTSSSEGLPTVLLEAQAMGVPVVCAKVGGVAEAIAPRSGSLIDDDRPEPFARAVLQAERHRPGAGSRQRMNAHIRETFGLDRMTRRLCEIYSD